MKKSFTTFAAIALITSLYISPATALGQAQSAPTAAKCVKVKNVVGKNYQTAQDIWRAQGFSVLVAKDATGRGRLPWIDSGWFVTAQFPKAGVCAKKNSGVRATVKKYTD
jgi:hypothetical protein